MNDYFYYFGFAYIIDMLIFFLKKLKKEQPEDTMSLNANMDAGQILNESANYYSKKDNSIRVFIGIVVAISCFIWLVIGYKSELPEKFWFGFLATLIVIYNSLIYGGSIIWGLTLAVTKIKPKYNLDLKKVLAPIGILVCCIEITIVSYILINHFLN